MNNNMQVLRNYRSTLNRKHYSILAMLLLLAGCEGGIVGTGSGPKDTTIYELKELPERISPDIPKHLETYPEDSTDDSRKLPTINDGISSLTGFRQNNLTPTVRAESWEELNLELSLLAILRLDAQHSITLTDLAIDDIASRCEQTSECVIPAGVIRVRYTQPVVNRLIKLYTDTLGFPQTDQESQNEYLRDVIDQLSQLLDSDVVFGETFYLKLGGTPYNYRLKTSLTKFDAEHEFTVQWRDDRSVVDLVSRPLSEEVVSFALSYFYQAGSPGENVIAKVESTVEGQTATLNIKVVSNDPDNAGILIEAHDVLLGASSSSSSTQPGVAITNTSDSSVESTDIDVSNGEPIDENTPPGASDIEGVVVFDDYQDYYTFKTIRTLQGQIDNDGGYANLEEYEIPDESPESIDYVHLYRETFDGDGFLLAGEICQEYSAINRCDTDTAFTTYGPGNASLVDSELYYSDGDFAVLESVQDAIRWQVVGLPADIREFAVVTAETGTALIERAFLCVGYQDVPGDVQLFCGATDEQLSSSTEVINIVPGEAISLISAASLAQAE